MNKQIINKKIEVSRYNQKTITGEIVLSGDVKMFNDSNIGKTLIDTDWIEPSRAIVKKGVRVFYMFKETRSGNYHEISAYKNGHRFSATKQVKEV